jgi:hypothetical protein
MAQPTPMRLPAAPDASSYASSDTCEQAWTPSAALAEILEEMSAVKAFKSQMTAASRRERARTAPHVPRRPTLHPRPFWISTLRLYSAEGVRAASAWRLVAPPRHVEPARPRRQRPRPRSKKPWRPVGELSRAFGDPPLHLQTARGRRASKLRIERSLEDLQRTVARRNRDTAKDVCEAMRDFRKSLTEDAAWAEEHRRPAPTTGAADTADSRSAALALLEHRHSGHHWGVVATN